MYIVGNEIEPVIFVQLSQFRIYELINGFQWRMYQYKDVSWTFTTMSSNQKCENITTSYTPLVFFSEGSKYRYVKEKLSTVIK